MTVRECCLTKLLPHILFEKKYFSTENGAGPVNQHCASCIGTLSFAIHSYHSPGSVWNSPTVPVTLWHSYKRRVTYYTVSRCCLYTINFTVQNVKKNDDLASRKNVSKWRQEAHNSLPKFWRIPKLDVRNVQFSPVRWLPPPPCCQIPWRFPISCQISWHFWVFPVSGYPVLCPSFWVSQKISRQNLRTAILNSRVKTSQAVKLSLLNRSISDEVLPFLLVSYCNFMLTQFALNSLAYW